MMLKKRLIALAVVGMCLASLCACGKNNSSHQAAEEKSVFIDSIRGEISDGEGDFYDVLHGSFGDICSSSATKNAFMTRVTSEGSVGYALNSVDFSYEDFYALEDSLKTLTATELSEFELLAYASYLDRTGNAFESSLSDASQKVLFNRFPSRCPSSGTTAPIRSASVRRTSTAFGPSGRKMKCSSATFTGVRSLTIRKTAGRICLMCILVQEL